jgi:hypothetical protein
VPKPNDTPVSVLTQQLFTFCEDTRRCAVGLRRRNAQIMRLQKTNPGTDPIQSVLGKELRENLDSLVGAIDKISKGLIRPVGVVEAEANTESIMEELMKGRKKI